MLDGGTENTNPSLAQDGEWIYLTGREETAQGPRPYVERLHVRTARRERIFISTGKEFEEPLYVLDARTLVTTHESPVEAPNYYVRDVKTRRFSALTTSVSPPDVDRVVPRFLTYTRDDGVALSGNLLLPPNYKSGEKIPILIWAYPDGYSDARAAARVRESPFRYTWGSHDPIKRLICLLALQGYGVLWDASMPVIGEANANDTAVRQFVANAKAAVDKLVELGIADQSRIAIGGFSYGAAMAATVLANSDRFAAGIGIAGAYNFTQAPDGFQTESRTLWEAPQAYMDLSAVMHADRIRVPFLLIHGNEDANIAASPLQSRQMYQALKGLGRTARLVLLPAEPHRPFAKQSLDHVAWEVQTWLDRFLKPKKPESSALSESSCHDC